MPVPPRGVTDPVLGEGWGDALRDGGAAEPERGVYSFCMCPGGQVCVCV